jgi:hypothetical protein
MDDPTLQPAEVEKARVPALAISFRLDTESHMLTWWRQA